MILRPKVIRDRLEKMREVVQYLQKIRLCSYDEFKGDFRNRFSAERGLQILAEALFDIGTHILSGHFGLSPDDYKEIVPLLVRERVITDNLANQLEKLSGFRNILVHEYLRIDPKKVYEHLQDDADSFELFMREINQWLDRVSTTGPSP